MTEQMHGIRVVRLRPQTFEVHCTCGYVGLGSKSGKPFWSKGEALDGVFRHQQELGLKPTIYGVGYTDFQPESSRRVHK